MRKLHKKYIVLNVFLIIYILSLSVGYAYFSESIKATGTAKTLSYYTQPLKPTDYITTDNSKLGSDNFSSSILNGNIIFKSVTRNHPYYYMYYDVPATTSWLTGDFYIYILNYAKDVNITDFTMTFYDNSSITEFDPSYGEDIERSIYEAGNYSDMSGNDCYGFGYIESYRRFKAGAFSTAGTTKQVYIRVSYKSQGATRYMYFYYYFNVK